MLPAIIGQLVVLLKDSALGYIIGYVEVVRSGQQLGAFYGNDLPALIVVAIIMIILNYTLTVVATKVEKRLRASKKGGGPGGGRSRASGGVGSGYGHHRQAVVI